MTVYDLVFPEKLLVGYRMHHWTDSQENKPAQTVQDNNNTHSLTLIQKYECSFKEKTWLLYMYIWMCGICLKFITDIHMCRIIWVCVYVCECTTINHSKFRMFLFLEMGAHLVIKTSQNLTDELMLSVEWQKPLGQNSNLIYIPICYWITHKR